MLKLVVAANFWRSRGGRRSRAETWVVLAASLGGALFSFSREDWLLSAVFISIPVFMLAGQRFVQGFWRVMLYILGLSLVLVSTGVTTDWLKALLVGLLIGGFVFWQQRRRSQVTP